MEQYILSRSHLAEVGAASCLPSVLRLDDPKDSPLKHIDTDPELPPPGFPATIPSPRSLDRLHEVMVRCTRCDLFLSRTQVVPGSGPPEAEVLLVGEAPGAAEDREGHPFVGRSGLLLDQMLGCAGLSRDDVFIANVIRCRPPENRNPRAAEVRACEGWLDQQLRLLQPRIVVPLGRFAVQYFLPDGRVSELQGEVVSVSRGGSNLSVYPLLHPAAILRNPRLRPSYEAQFEKLREWLRG